MCYNHIVKRKSSSQAFYFSTRSCINKQNRKATHSFGNSRTTQSTWTHINWKKLHMRELKGATYLREDTFVQKK